MNKLTTTLSITICSSLLLLSSSIRAEVSPEAGITLTPEQMTWLPNPRVVGLGVVKIIGDGKKTGHFIHRVKFPAGRVVKAHSHPDDRTYTVISGTWHIGWGDEFDESKLIALPPGSFYTEPAGVPHFISTPEEAIVQVSGTGPTAVHYVDIKRATK